MSDFWRGKRVIVTGGAGFLGSHVVELLQERGCEDVIVPLIEEYDLTQLADIRRLYGAGPSDMVLHLAAVVGGIGANREKPGTFFYKNMMMGVQLMEQARLHGIPKFLAVATICAYPKHTPVPFREEDLWCGYPEETNAPYGLAKKMLIVQAQAYRDEFGYNAVVLLPVNLFGPRDNFNLHSSHVIPALIRKCFEAKDRGVPTLEIWGTGRPSREFLYVEDAARGLLLAAERYDSPEPVNLGTGREIRISDLVDLIVKGTGFEGELRYDPSRPDGQPRRCLDTARARERFGFTAAVSLEDGLQRTIEWYDSVRHARPDGGVG